MPTHVIAGTGGGVYEGGWPATSGAAQFRNCISLPPGMIVTSHPIYLCVKAIKCIINNTKHLAVVAHPILHATTTDL